VESLAPGNWMGSIRDASTSHRAKRGRDAGMTDTGSRVITRWAVLQEHAVTDDDLDPQDRVSDDAVEQWAIAARSAYLGRCHMLQGIRERLGLDLQGRTESRPSGAPLGRPTAVLVSASATEVRPGSFVILVRIRPIGDDNGIPVNVRWVIRLLGQDTERIHEITDNIRDELIELERSAEHWN
jgi:hypothetical protein